MINIKLYGADWCPDCQRAKAFLRDNQINYDFIDVDKDADATAFVERINKGKRIIPTILIDDVPYTNPNNAILSEVLGIEKEQESKIYDSIIIGAGAAGLTASLYAQRDHFSTLILEKRVIGGNAYMTEKIENYPGFINISGPELTQRMADHAQHFGATIRQGVEVQKIRKKDGLFYLSTSYGQYIGQSVILSTGSSYRKLRIPNEDLLIGSGIHFCATCDGAFYKDKEVIVIGGGNSALEEGIHLAGIARRVKFVNLTEQFTATQTYIDELNELDNVEVYHNRTSVSFVQNEAGLFDGLKVKNNSSGDEEIIQADGAFIFIGLQPNTALVKDLVELNDRQFIVTDKNLQTSVPGIFAAGDNREGAIAQIAFATGEGVAVSYTLRKYLKTHKVAEAATLTTS